MPNNDGSLNMGPYEPVQEIEDPQNNEEVYLGSFNSIIQHNLGTYVACEFLIGTNNLERREGILYSGGNNYVTLYQPCLLYTSPSPRDRQKSRMPSSA